MKAKTIIYLLVAAIVAGGGYYFYADGSEDPDKSYQLGTVSRGAIENTVTVTGTLSPVTTVEVGTQVSGTLDTVLVDYNDYVEVGQVMAILDTVLLKATVIDAEASLERSEAQLELAVADHDRYKSLYDKGLLSEVEFLTSQAELKICRADRKSAVASLERAKRNLGYAVITSPINGIVIEKSVESGQTVAASLSAPTLFVMAQDLSQMEILAEVDESDIGEIEQGQTARFEVAAYDDKQFEGVVRQVRLQPQTISNVVTYYVVVEAANEDNLLLPGMTATIDFIVDERQDVLTVPNKALRFKPSDGVLQDFFAQRRAERQNSAGEDGPPTGEPGEGMGGPPPGMGSEGESERKAPRMVWYVDTDGNLAATPVQTGISDGSNTEIVASRDLDEGMQVILGLQTATTSESDNSERRPMGFPGPGGPGF